MKKFVTTLFALCVLSALPLAACKKRQPDHVCTWRTVREPDCTTDGLRERTCNCGKTGDEAIEKLGHDYADEWSTDEENHWHECTRCGDIKDEAAHTLDGSGNCDCGYKVTYTRSLVYTEVTAEDGATVTGYAVSGLEDGATDTDIVIPAEHSGKPVTAIANSAFYKADGSSAIESVTVPDSVKQIGASAFYQCANLKTVKLGSGLEVIGDYAFYGSGITAIETPASVKTFGAGVFYNCTSLQSAKVNAAETVGNYWFYGDTALKKVEFGKGVTCQLAEKSYALGGCTALTEIVINGNIQFEKYSLYGDTENSISVTFGDGMTEIPANALCPDTLSSALGEMIKSITVGKNVKKIGEHAFDMCNNVKSLVLPEGVEEICKGALKMKGVEELTLPKSVKYLRIGSCSLSSLKRLNYGGTISDWLKISIEGNALANPLCFGADLYIGGQKVTDVVIDGVEEVPAFQFSGATFTSVTFGESVKRVGQDAFDIARNAPSQLDSTITKIVILSKEFSVTASWGDLNGSCEIYYKGTPEEMLANTTVTASNVHWFNDRVHYFYSETGTEAAYAGAEGWTYGGLWHFVGGQVTKWN